MTLDPRQPIEMITANKNVYKGIRIVIAVGATRSCFSASSSQCQSFDFKDEGIKSNGASFNTNSSILHQPRDVCGFYILLDQMADVYKLKLFENEGKRYVSNLGRPGLANLTHEK